VRVSRKKRRFSIRTGRTLKTGSAEFWLVRPSNETVDGTRIPSTGTTNRGEEYTEKKERDYEHDDESSYEGEEGRYEDDDDYYCEGDTCPGSQITLYVRNKASKSSIMSRKAAQQSEIVG
jgi:hypothetical protein